MIDLTIQNFGINVDVIFPTPRTFSKELVDSDARWLIDSASGFAVPSEHVRMRQADILFGYDLSVQLFGGNGHFSLDAQKAGFSAKNAKGRADGNLLREMVSRFLRHFAKEKSTVAFSANAYARPESKAVRDEYLERFRFDPRITMPGAVGFLRIDGWPSDVRFGVEPAIGIEDSLFLAWNTRFSVSEISEIPDKIVNIFVEAAGVYGLKIQPLF